jgi:menaquinone-specific isochorismate synthase
MTARVTKDLHVLDLVERLHPTPAVGGAPTREAVELLRRLEPFPRGWYAGAVGWFDAREDGTFATAIRSGLNTPHDAWLFAGAGIVAGSRAQAEWDEAGDKLATMERAIESAEAAR